MDVEAPEPPPTLSPQTVDEKEIAVVEEGVGDDDDEEDEDDRSKEVRRISKSYIYVYDLYILIIYIYSNIYIVNTIIY